MNRSALTVAIMTLLYSSTNVATDMVVTTPQDTETNDGLCSLREAILAANTNTGSDMPGECPAGEANGDVISFSDAVFASDLTLQLSAGELTITADVTIDGTVGGNTLTIRGTGSDRIFRVDTDPGMGATELVGLSNLVLTGGVAPTGGAIHASAGSETDLRNLLIEGNVATGDAATEGGGGIFNAGSMSISATAISGNTATGGSGSGGGIFNNAGTLTLSDSNIFDNVAARAGGGIETLGGSVEMSGSSLVNNTAGNNPGNGGGLHVTGAGTVEFTGGRVNGNAAGAEGGGLWNGSGAMTIDGTTITGNTASGAGSDQGGGGIFNNGGILMVLSATIVSNTADGASGSGGGVLGDGGTMTISGTTLSGNTASRAGGGIEITDVNFGSVSATLTDVVVSDNATGSAPGNGGGMHLSGAAFASISGGSFTNNRAAAEGGGLWNSSGEMVISGTTISGNTASGAAADQGGGGVFNNGGVLYIQSANIASNVADGSAGSGGGVLGDGGTIFIFGGTISGNSAIRAGGGIELTDANFADAKVTLSGVEVTGNATGSAPGNGGGLHLTGLAEADVTNGTFSGNVAAAEGGGLWNSGGVLTINGTTISGNTASGSSADQGGGGVFNNGGNLNISNAEIAMNVADGNAGSGGGVLGDGGTTTITDTTISGNTASRAGGGIEITDINFNQASTLLNNVTVSSNSVGPSPGNGGGLHLTGTANAAVTGGAFSNNSATAEGGGLWNAGGSMTIDGTLISSNVASGDGADQGGGGVFNNGGVLNIVSTATTTSISGNFADGELGSGGGLLSDGGAVTVSGTRIESNGSHRAGGGIEIDSTGTTPARLTLAGTTLINNFTGPPGFASPGNGGGLHITGPGTVDIRGGVVSTNSAASEGGGLWNDGGTMTILDTTVSGNTASGNDADQGGGGIFNAGGTVSFTSGNIENNLADGSLGSGGGILNDGGTLRVDGAVVGGNTSQRAGGGIETASGSVSVTDSTFRMNATGPNPGNGGGLHVTGPGTVDVSISIFDGNVAAAEGGGLWNGSGTMTILNTEISDNVASGPDADQGGGGIFNAGGTLELFLEPVPKGVGPPVVILENTADGLSGSGGGILSDGGNITVDGYFIVGNTANRAGGGIELTNGASAILNGARLTTNNAGGAAPAPGNGGGLHIAGSGSVAAQNVDVVGNIAAEEGGGFWNGTDSTISIGGSTFQENVANGVDVDQGGGGLFNLGEATVENSRFMGNIATADSPGEGGGGIFNSGDLTLRETEFDANEANTALGNGGAILNAEGGIARVTGGSMTNNIAARAGGAVENIGTFRANNLEASMNSAGINGGMLHITGAGTASFDASTLAGNVALNEGGGLWVSENGSLTLSMTTVDSNDAPFGGGIFVDAGGGSGATQQKLTATQSAVTRNTAANSGGGVALEDGIANFENVTVSGNASGDGGGLFINEPATVILASTTVAANTAEMNGGGVFNGGMFSAANSIFGDNTAIVSGPDISGEIQDDGALIIEDVMGAVIVTDEGPGVGTVTGVDPLLGVLADNGGPTETHALLEGSPAIDGSSPDTCPSQDQRGFGRIDERCDIGAFELDADPDQLFRDGFEN